MDTLEKEKLPYTEPFMLIKKISFADILTSSTPDEDPTLDAGGDPATEPGNPPGTGGNIGDF